MITRVTFENYKALKSTAVDLKQFTVLVGPNASGKTSILEGLSFAAIYEDTTPNDHRLKWLNRFSTGARADEFRISYDSDSSRGFTLIFKPGATWDVRITPQDVSPPRTKFLRLSPKLLAKPTDPSQMRPTLAEDGMGLASYLAHLKLRESEAFDRLEQVAKDLLTSLKALRIDRVMNLGGEAERYFPRDPLEIVHASGTVFEVVLAQMRSGELVPGNLLSEGTLLLLGMLAVIFGPDRPQLLLIDDMDRALHPRGQVEFVKLVQGLLKSEEFKELQIVATTHSPYLLDALEPSQVRLTALNENGHVVVAKLSDHPEFETWKESMLPGEMWSYFGEKWITEAGGTVVIS